MRTVKGDLIQRALCAEFDVIIHGCNCMCTMGAGIAKSIKREFPEAYEADRQTEAGSKDKLGSFSYASVERAGHTITIVNAYTQYHWRGRGVRVNYEALRSVMQQVKTEFSGLRIGYPKIGAGLARGDWTIISKIIDEELDGEDHVFVEFIP